MTYKLIVRLPDGKEQTFVLDDKTDICHIGRADENEVQILKSEVSRHHCQIQKTPQGYQLTDLKSTSGTYVNNIKVTKHLLHHNDQIRIDDTVIDFVSPAQAPVLSAVGEKPSSEPAEKPGRRRVIKRSSLVIPAAIVILLTLIAGLVFLKYLPKEHHKPTKTKTTPPVEVLSIEQEAQEQLDLVRFKERVLADDPVAVKQLYTELLTKYEDTNIASIVRASLRHYGELILKKCREDYDFIAEKTAGYLKDKNYLAAQAEWQGFLEKYPEIDAEWVEKTQGDLATVAQLMDNHFKDISAEVKQLIIQKEFKQAQDLCQTNLTYFIGTQYESQLQEKLQEVETGLGYHQLALKADTLARAYQYNEAIEQYQALFAQLDKNPMAILTKEDYQTQFQELKKVAGLFNKLITCINNKTLTSREFKLADGRQAKIARATKEVLLLSPSLSLSWTAIAPEQVIELYRRCGLAPDDLQVLTRYYNLPEKTSLALKDSIRVSEVVPPPSETPVEVIVSGRTSTLKSIKIVKVGQNIPKNYGEAGWKRVGNCPGYTWYVSQHYALKTDLSEKMAHHYLTLAELAYPHYIWVIGREPPDIENTRMTFAYGKSYDSINECIHRDLGPATNMGGGGITFPANRCAYNYPSGGLRYHKRDLVIHENLHLFQVCATGKPTWIMPGRFVEGITYPFANHVYDEEKKILTVMVLDKATANNPYDKALRKMRAEFRTMQEFIEENGGEKYRPTLYGLYTQFFWTDPDRCMKWRIWRDELFRLNLQGEEMKKHDIRLMKELFGSFQKLNTEWKRWVDQRRSTFHYVDWGWEQSGNTLWSYGYPKHGEYSRTDINFAPNEKVEYEPLRMDYPAEPMPAIVGPVKRGVPEPSVGCVVIFPPGKGREGMGLGLSSDKPQTDYLKVLVEDGSHLIIDGSDLNIKTKVFPFPEALKAAMKSDGHRVGLTIKIARSALKVTVRAGKGAAEGEPPAPKGEARPSGRRPDGREAMEEMKATVRITQKQRQRLMTGHMAVLARKGYHGVIPFIDDARRMEPDLSKPAPLGRWRFAGEPELYRLYRAAWRLGKHAPTSLINLKEKMVTAADKDPTTQQAAIDAYHSTITKVIHDLRAVRDTARADLAIAELLGVSVNLEIPPESTLERPVMTASIQGAYEGEITGTLSFAAEPAEMLGSIPQPKPVKVGAGSTEQVKWSLPIKKDHITSLSVRARANLVWRGVKFALEDSKTVFPSIPCWWTIGPFDNKGDGTKDTKHPVERESLDLTKKYTGKGDKKIEWKKAERPAESKVDSEFLLDFDEMYGGENVAAYALVWVDCPKATEAVLALGSDDGVVVWLNDKRVHTNMVARGYRSKEDRVPIRLKTGKNKLLVKVAQGGGGWSLCAHILDKDGNPLRGVTFTLKKK